MTAPFILRAPTRADVPALSILSIAAFVAKFGALYRPEDLLPFLADTYSGPALAAALADPANVYQVAERGGVLVGWCRLALRPAFPEHARGAHPMELFFGGRMNFLSPCEADPTAHQARAWIGIQDRVQRFGIIRGRVDNFSVFELQPYIVKQRTLINRRRVERDVPLH